MIIRKAEFITSAVEPHQYPNLGLPEIALAGRSNVGKSSLINARVNRSGLAKVGNTPGNTSLINFFNVNDTLLLVDLPGYGYAKVSKEERKSWGSLAETYLNTREHLKIILLLLDIRHEPTEDDALMLEYIRESGRKLIVVANKSDKISRSEQKRHIDRIRNVLNLSSDIDIIPISSLKKTGIEALWERIEMSL